MKRGQGWDRISGLLIPSHQMLGLSHLLLPKGPFQPGRLWDGGESGLGILLSLGMVRGGEERERRGCYG